MSDFLTICNPSVFLITSQIVHDTELELFLHENGSADWKTDTEQPAEVVPEIAGRLCYQSFSKPRPGGNQAYLHHILEVGHGSVLEHSVFGFIITGISRSLSHELVRHRIASYSQLSQRYVDESEGEYVVPDVIANDEELFSVWQDAIAHAHRAYCKLADMLYVRLIEQVLPGDGTGQADRTAIRKAARGAARSVLPNATETKIFITMNARSWRHFIEMRASRHADIEIRKLAVTILETLQLEAPNLFGDYVLTDLPDGTREATTPYRKV